jgi:predicted outer membrane repeat protein
MHTSIRLHHRIRALLALLLTLALLGLLALPAHAAGFTVTTLADSGDGSLREAIEQANMTTDADTITFGVSGTIVLASTLPAIANELTIDGTGQSITISGNNAVRVMVVNSGETLNLNALTIGNGLCNNCPGGGLYTEGGTINVNHSTFSGNSAACSPSCTTDGGAIVTRGGVLNVSNSTFASNSADGLGGGIYNISGSVTLSNSTFASNSADGAGGGIYNISGSVTLSNSTFSGNSSFSGGGIRNDGTLMVSNSTFSANSATNGGVIRNSGGSVTLSNSTFSGNSATLGGVIYSSREGTLTVSDSTFIGNSAADAGGIFNDNGSVTLSNSTISGNSVSGFGGGIYSDDGSVTLSNSTISGNSATQSSGGIYSGGTLTVSNSTFSDNSAQSGGGIVNVNQLTLANTIVANSQGGDCLNDGGSISATGANLIEDGSCNVAGVLLGDPKLGPLQDNGGPTQTIALLVGSPAIDAGDDGVCAAAPVNNLDQRGLVRPQGSHCDIGAYEAEPAFPATSVLDDFNRANGKVGGNWDGLTGTEFYKIASNKLDVQLGGPLVWKPASFGASQEAFVTLSTIDSRSPSQGLLLKVQSGSIPNAGVISVVYDAKAKAVRVSALRLGQNGAWTLYPNQAATFANGDVLGARAKDNGTVEIYKNGTLLTTVTLNAADQQFFNAKGGKIGVWTAGAPNALFDDFGGGTAGS